MAIYRPGNGTGIDSAKAMANNRGFVYASVNAIGREIMNIDWRLFEVDGEDHNEQTDHALLDLLDGVNPDMTGPELKYMLSAHLDLTGNAFWYLDGVKNETDKPKAIYPLNPSQIRVVVNTETFPFSITGYQMKLENKTINFQPYQILHFRLPNANNPFEGVGVVQAGADYIDNDNYAMEFNRKFFQNGARPAGILETEMVSETQVESLKIGFTSVCIPSPDEAPVFRMEILREPPLCIASIALAITFVNTWRISPLLTRIFCKSLNCLSTPMPLAIHFELYTRSTLSIRS
jgi:HK97 family phage portal protein